MKSYSKEANAEGEVVVNDLLSRPPLNVIEGPRDNPLAQLLYETKGGIIFRSTGVILCLLYLITHYSDETYSDLSNNEHIISVPFLFAYDGVLHLIMLILYGIVKSGGTFNRKLIGVICSFLLFAVTLSDLHLNKLTATTRVLLFHEALRLQLKSISFLVETSSEKVAASASISSYFYFLFAPTLIYRMSYDRSDKVRWSRVINGALWFFLTIGVVIPAFYKYVFPCLLIDLTQFTWSLLLKNFLTFLPLPFFVYAYFGTFIYFEMWCGAWAEVLKYSDHRYFGVYVRQNNASKIFATMNIVVSTWIKRYLFVPLLKTTDSRLIAYTVTMFLSAAYHEIVYCYTLKQFILISYIAGLFIGPQLLLDTSKRVTRVLQISLFLFGFSTHFYPHVLEYSARIYCVDEGSTFIRLIPLHFTCITRALSNESHY